VYNFDMPEDKASSEHRAKIERSVGIRLDDKKTEAKGFSRRAFLKAGLVTGGAVAIASLAKSSGERRINEEIFEGGLWGNFRGTVHVLRGTVIYDRPATWYQPEPDRTITTNFKQETWIARINSEQEEFQIENPKLFFRAANEFSTNTATFGQSGQERHVDLDTSYVVFKASDGMPDSVVGSINRSVTKWGCINIGAIPKTVGYQPASAENWGFEVLPEAVDLE